MTDNDNIEISNLNRQFLFKKEHIGKSKSKIASEEIRKMNNNFNSFNKGKYDYNIKRSEKGTVLKLYFFKNYFYS